MANITKINLKGIEYNLTDSEAQNLIAQLRESTYNKTEVDTLVGAIDDKIDAIDMASYAKTADVDAQLATKADKEDTYTKEEVNALGNQLKAIAEARLPIDSFNTWSETVATKAEVKTVSDKVDAITVPTKVSELTNDSKYQTKSEVNTAIQKVVGAAPEALDTLEEIATKLSSNDDAVAGIVNTLSGKADKSEIPSLAGYATESWVENKSYLTEHQDISGKVDKVSGKGLSTNDYTAADKAKVDATPTFWVGTQAEYDAIAVKDNKTFYYITEE